MIHTTYSKVQSNLARLEGMSPKQVDELSAGTISTIKKMVEFVEANKFNEDFYYDEINDGCITQEIDTDGNYKLTVHEETVIPPGLLTNFWRGFCEYFHFIPTSNQLMDRIKDCSKMSVRGMHEDL